MGTAGPDEPAGAARPAGSAVIAGPAAKQSDEPAGIAKPDEPRGADRAGETTRTFGTLLQLSDRAPTLPVAPAVATDPGTGASSAPAAAPQPGHPVLEGVAIAGVPIEIGRVPEFNARVYEIARAVPPGQTITYGEIAERLGDKLLARDVGAALGQNPWPIVVPCHRVTAAGGKPGGFSARGGVNTKLRLLTIEGAAFVQPAPPKASKARAGATPAAPQPDLFG